MSDTMRVSIIIPVLNEEQSISRTLDVLAPLQADEIIVVDGGSTDCTVALCRRHGVVPLVSARGRANQMNYGARHATGDVLLFLHADTLPPLSALGDIRTALADPTVVGGRFDVKLDSERFIHRVIGFMISWRSRLSKVGTGDQGIFVRRELFQELGGYPAIPLMEDIAFSRALKQSGKVACLRSCMVTSARRWQSAGAWRTVFRMWTLKSLYLLGVSPIRLARYYDDVR